MAKPGGPATPSTRRSSSAGAGRKRRRPSLCSPSIRECCLACGRVNGGAGGDFLRRAGALGAARASPHRRRSLPPRRLPVHADWQKPGCLILPPCRARRARFRPPFVACYPTGHRLRVFFPFCAMLRSWIGGGGSWLAPEQFPARRCCPRHHAVGTARRHPCACLAPVTASVLLRAGRDLGGREGCSASSRSARSLRRRRLQADMGCVFRPFRRAVRYLKAEPSPIRPLL